MEKERRTKALLLSTLVVVVATVSIAFAAMSRTLSINGIGKMDTASWSVYFDNLGNAKITRGAKEVGKPSISTDKGTVQDINVKLSNPKDEISYTVDIVNAGTIDAEITTIKDIELTEVQKKIFEFKVTYTETGEILKDGDVLPAGDTKNITINIKFRDDITEADLPSESQTISLSYQITYTQYDGGNSDLPIGPNGGGVTTGNSILASADAEILNSDYPEETTFFNGTLKRREVESITFLSSNIVPSEYADNAWDASQNNDRSVMAWHTPGDTVGLFKVYIGASGGVSAPENSMALFACFSEMKELNFNGNFDTTSVTDMGWMFLGCTSLTSLDLTSFNTSNVTNMSNMLTACRGLTSLDLKSFNTSKVTDMSYMFMECSSLTSLDLSYFDVSSVTTMEGMFYHCSSITTLDLSSFDTSKVTDMEDMFYGCTSLTSIDLRNADFSNVNNNYHMFDTSTNFNQIIVKDEQQRTWLTSNFNYLTNVVLPSEL